MTITVEIKPEFQAALATQAAARGMDVPAYAAAILEQAAHPAPLEPQKSIFSRKPVPGPRLMTAACLHDRTGVHVHDYSPSVSAGAIRATLAASMYSHNIPQILTINVRDFARFRGLSILHPADVLHEPTP